MPFVQRVVTPIYISRTKKTTLGTTTTIASNGVQTTITSTTTTTTTTSSTAAATTAATSKISTELQQNNHHHHLNNKQQSSSTSNGTALDGISVVVVDAKTSAIVVDGTISSNYQKQQQQQQQITPVRRCIIKPTSTKLNDYEFEAVTNLTLSNALRQLASLVLIANDIFTELNSELHNVGERAKCFKIRIDTLEKTVEEFDPKMVAVPESDLATFVQIKNHFKTTKSIDTALFTPETRSENLRQLYDAAAKTPVNAMEEMDRIAGQSDRRSSDIFLCTPVLGQTRRRMKSNIDVEIETRMPAAIEELRRWTSSEAIGDITVTPDCVARVGFNGNNSMLCTSMSMTSNFSASGSGATTINQLSADVTDDITVISSSRINNEITNEMPLDHRLPSPEEQCQTIALRFPAEVIRVDTSGKRFERMCVARKSMLNVQINIGEHNNLNDDIQTVKRRSRSRKPRCKRRNTIAGTDQKEIEEAVKRDDNLDDEIESAAVVQQPTSENCNEINTICGNIGDGGNGVKTLIVPRSKSNDILKKDSPTNTMDTVRTLARMSHFNTLKQWGRNRLRLINRNSTSSTGGNNGNGCDDILPTNVGMICNSTGANYVNNNSKQTNNTKESTKVYDIDEINVYETVISKNKRKFMEKERKLSHERKPSYSSSEKSLTITSQSSTHSSSLIPASVNPVKLRESSAIRRQRRSGLGHKDELNSSSGNWSASSESGRTSIGSEITAQPKSSASSTSLNHSHHPGSGPPSSIISRRRFLNTSASSSVTSEGTVTPDIQIQDSYPYDDETSSAYSCDTEGYYTSFHVDSGLKTLKEEEPVTPLHSSSALSSTNSFGSSSNKTVLSAENEYELFGKGSTSTTASSAGTVCTTLMTAGSDRCLVTGGPAVPERKSSLTKLNRSNSTASSNNSTLERSCSSSTVGSTLERTGTIKRNGILLKKEVPVTVHATTIALSKTRIESPDSGNNTSSSPIETNSSSSPVHCIPNNSEFEYSECSDLEGVERVERIRVKTTINSSRIPSLCVITPSNSDDDENHNDHHKIKLELPIGYGRNRQVSPPPETNLDKINFKTKPPPAKQNGQVQIMTINKETGYATLHTFDDKQKQPSPELPPTNVEIHSIPITTIPPPPPTKHIELKKDIQHFKKSTLLPLNTMFGRLRGVLPHLKKSPLKDVIVANEPTADEEPIYDDAGEYVTIADVKNNNQKKQQNGIYYSNEMLKRNLATVLSGNLNQETEYVSLNELPSTIRCESNLLTGSIISTSPSPPSKEKSTTVSASKITAATATMAGKFLDSGKINNHQLTDVVEYGSSVIGSINSSSSNNNIVTNDTIATTTSTITNNSNKQDDEEGMMTKKGARVTLDAHGKVVYSSDSLKRRKGAHTTFIPGPCVKDLSAAPSAYNHNQQLTTDIKSLTPTASLNSGGVINRKPTIVRPVISQSLHKPIPHINNKTGAKQVNNIEVNSSNIVQHLQRVDLPSPPPTPPSSLLIQSSVSENPVAKIIIASQQTPAVTKQTTTTTSSLIQQQQQPLPPPPPPPPLQQQQQQKPQQINKQMESMYNQDYQHLSRDQIDSGEQSILGIVDQNCRSPYVSSTLPRFASYGHQQKNIITAAANTVVNVDHQNPQQRYQSPVQQHRTQYQQQNQQLQQQTPSLIPSSPFQRGNNAYWTLQTRKQLGGKKTEIYNSTLDQTIVSKDDFLLTHKKTIEELYSTPNKLLKKKSLIPSSIDPSQISQSNQHHLQQQHQQQQQQQQQHQLRSTPQGFNTYFSPISKTADQNQQHHLQQQQYQQQKISPIDPRNTGGAFKTSTPSKSTDEYSTPNIVRSLTNSPIISSAIAEDVRNKLYIQEGIQSPYGSQVSSPISSGRSTPRLEPQAGRNADPIDLSQTCSDRLGTPKTSLMDFKKLLLSKAGKTIATTTKPSAVEQLKLRNQAKLLASSSLSSSPMPSQKLTSGSVVLPPSSTVTPQPSTQSALLNTSMNILDLSGSPKTFANRRMIRQGNFGGSPSKSSNNPSVGNKHMSPRSAWKFNNYRTDVMSTAIPEVNSEEDSSSPNNSNERKQSASQLVNDQDSFVGIKTLTQIPIRSLVPTVSSLANKPIEESVSSSINATNVNTPPSAINSTKESTIVVDPINIKNNIFLQAEENNFMRGEMATKSLSRAQLSQARTSFLMAGNNQTVTQHQPTQLRSAQFKNGHYTGISPTKNLVINGGQTSTEIGSKFLSNTEPIFDTNADGKQAPSLETAL